MWRCDGPLSITGLGTRRLDQPVRGTNGTVYGLDDDCDGQVDELWAFADDPRNCGACGRVCPEGVDCDSGRCDGAKAHFLVCGPTARDARDFIIGEVADKNVRLAPGCDIDDATQAVLVPGGATWSGRVGPRSQEFVAFANAGGRVVSSSGTSDMLYTRLVGPVERGARRGSCQRMDTWESIRPETVFTPDDPFWAAVGPRVAADGTVGCGYDVADFPGITPLGGWTHPGTVFLGYIGIGAGRLWFVDVIWTAIHPDGDRLTDDSRRIMAHIIAGDIAE